MKMRSPVFCRIFEEEDIFMEMVSYCFLFNERTSLKFGKEQVPNADLEKNEMRFRWYK